MKNVALAIVWRRFSAAFAMSLLALYSRPATAADLIMMVEPFYTPDRAAEVYQPLIAYLNAATGHRIELVTPRNYHFFWRDIRQNVPVDLMLAEPPITDYRAQRYQTEPLVRTAEPTSYTLLASDQIENPTLDSLVGRSIVTMPSPSLGFAVLLDFYRWTSTPTRSRSRTCSRRPHRGATASRSYSPAKRTPPSCRPGSKTSIRT